MKNSILISLFYLVSLSTYSQVSINGVFHNPDDTPAEFANVLLHTSSDSNFIKGTITDIDGAFTFELIETGNYYIIGSQVGYQDIVITDIVANEDVSLSSSIFQEGLQLEEVVVSAQRPLIELDAEKIVVNVENSTLSVGNTALEVLQKSPGVVVDQDDRISLKGKQGVLVLIDGKNQFLTGDQLTSLLASMPANSIKKIEIIHNPSAKYEAQGNAGIINIELRKNENLGLNGTATLSLGYGITPKGNGGINMNYRSEKTNVYGSYDYSHWESESTLDLRRRVPYENGITSFNQNSIFRETDNDHNFKLGVDYTVDDKTTFGVLVRGGFGDEAGGTDNATAISGNKPQIFDRSTTISTRTENWNQLSANVNLRHEIGEGSDVNVDLDYSTFDEGSFDNYTNLYFDNTMNEVVDPYLLRNNSDINVEIMGGKIDYTKKISDKWNLETGVKASMVSTTNATIFETQVIEDWRLDDRLTNTFRYDEGIYVGYVNMSTSFGKYSLQTGLRLEHTTSDGLSLTLDENVKREYTELFPSVSISRPIGEKHNVSLSYSRRLDRPNYRALNPFIGFLDQFTFQKGNPFLNPQFTNSYGVNYSLGRSLFVSANYSRTTDAMTQVLEQNDETQETFQTDINFDTFDNYSLNITAPLVLSEWWTARSSFTGFINDFRTNYSNGEVDNNQASYVLNLTNEFTLSQKVNAEITGQYQSALTYGIFGLEPQYFVDMGVTMKVMDGQGRLKVSVKDVFNVFENTLAAQQGSIDLNVRNKWESQRVHVSFSYNFGNQKVKAARNRRTANSEEERRVN